VIPELSIVVREADNECVVLVAGEVDMASAPTLAEALESVTGTVIVDLAAVAYLDSSGIAVLVHARKQILKKGGTLKIRNPRDNVHAVFRAVGLAHWID
jgi:anti-sigma B factor antagonist